MAELLIFYGGLSAFLVGVVAYSMYAIRKYDREHKSDRNTNAHA